MAASSTIRFLTYDRFDGCPAFLVGYVHIATEPFKATLWIAPIVPNLPDPRRGLELQMYEYRVAAELAKATTPEEALRVLHKEAVIAPACEVPGFRVHLPESFGILNEAIYILARAAICSQPA